VSVVGYLVGYVDDLGLKGGPQVGFEGVGPGGIIVGGVLDDPLTHLPSQVEAAESGVALLELFHDAQAVRVVVKAASPGHQRVEHHLAGVAKGGVAQVVGHGDGLDQILVKHQRAGDGAGDLGDLQGVGEPRTVMVALIVDEHLRLVLQTPESGGVQNAVAIALESGAIVVLVLGVGAPPRGAAPLGIGRKLGRFHLFETIPGQEHGVIPLAV